MNTEKIRDTLRVMASVAQSAKAYIAFVAGVAGVVVGYVAPDSQLGIIAAFLVGLGAFVATWKIPNIEPQPDPAPEQD